MFHLILLQIGIDLFLYLFLATATIFMAICETNNTNFLDFEWYRPFRVMVVYFGPVMVPHTSWLEGFLLLYVSANGRMAQMSSWGFFRIRLFHRHWQTLEKYNRPSTELRNQFSWWKPVPVSLSFYIFFLSLQSVQLRLSVVEVLPGDKLVPIGHVLVGSQLSGTKLTHWNQMMTSLRKPVAMWHRLRRKWRKKDN